MASIFRLLPHRHSIRLLSPQPLMSMVRIVLRQYYADKQQ